MRNVVLAFAVSLAFGNLGSFGLDAQTIRAPRFASGVTVAVHDPFSFEYIRPSREDVPKVALVGEEVAIQWELFNGFGDPFEAPIPNRRFVDFLRITAVESPVEVERLSLRLAAFERRRERVVRSPADPPSVALRLDGGEAIYARATILGLSQPGVYKLRIGPAFEGPHNMTDVVEFELRALTGRAERAEFYIHRLWNAQELGTSCARIRSEIDALLAVHEHAVAAYEHLGSCAANEGRIPEALSAFSRALELLDQGLDDLFIDSHRPGQVERRAASLRETVATLRTGRLPQPVVHE